MFVCQGTIIRVRVHFTFSALYTRRAPGVPTLALFMYSCTTVELSTPCCAHARNSTGWTSSVTSPSSPFSFYVLCTRCFTTATLERLLDDWGEPTRGKSLRGTHQGSSNSLDLLEVSAQNPNTRRIETNGGSDSYARARENAEIFPRGRNTRNIPLPHRKCMQVQSKPDV